MRAEDVARLIIEWRGYADELLGSSVAWDGDEAAVYLRCADELENLLMRDAE